MAVSTFVPPQNPNKGYGFKVKARVQENAYGDGYTQRVGDGLNTMMRQYSFVWGPISPANADAIEAFFSARGGIEPFFYTPPLDAARGKPKIRFVCPEWQRDTTEINMEQVSAVFVEDFGLST